MADIEITEATVTAGRIERLQVRFHGAAPRTIGRDVALAWARDGHSLIPVAGHGHDVARGSVLTVVEVGEDVFLRTDTRVEALDLVTFPGEHG